MPLISVLMAAYNAEKFISFTIDSVLSQTFIDFEFIIVNDGSTDSTELKIFQYNDKRIVYLYKENEGLSKALNAGLKIAKGKYIARIDADDICKNDRFYKQFNFLEKNPDYFLCGSIADVIDDNGNYIYTYKDLPFICSDILLQMEYKNCIIHSSAFFSREIALKLGGYYEPIKQYFEDYMLFYKFSKIGNVFNFSEPLVEYRIVPGSISTRNKNKKYEQLVLQVVKRGYITEHEKDFLFKFKRKHSDKKIQLSNYYLSLSRLIFIHQGDYIKSYNYFILAFKSNYLNFNLITSFLYLLLKFFIYKINSLFYK